MSAKVAELIRNACAYARADGIKIARGAIFEWSEGSDKPIACCALGTVLYQAGITKDYRFLSDVSKLLNVDEFFIHRFLMGFDRNYQVLIDTSQSDRPTWVKDEISGLGISLAKELL